MRQADGIRSAFPAVKQLVAAAPDLEEAPNPYMNWECVNPLWWCPRGYALFLLRTPPGYQGVSRLIYANGRLTLREHGSAPVARQDLWLFGADDRLIDLTDEEREGVRSTAALFKLAITPYYASLMDPRDPDVLYTVAGPEIGVASTKCCITCGTRPASPTAR